MCLTSRGVARYVFELTSQNGSTALTMAASKGHVDTIGLLLDWGADLAATTSVSHLPDQNVASPEQSACFRIQSQAALYDPARACCLTDWTDSPGSRKGPRTP